MDYKTKVNKLIENGELVDAYYYLLTNDQDRYEDAFYYGNLGWILNGLERYEEAKTNLIHTLELFGDDNWVYGQLGVSYAGLGEYDMAIVNFKKALDLHFDEPWIQGQLGYCYYQLEQYDEAILYYENALMDSNDLDTMLMIINVYIDNHDYEQAKYYMQQAMLLYPRDEVFGEMFCCYNRMEDYEGGYRCLLRISADYDEHVTLYNIGVSLMKLKRYDESLDYFLQVSTKYGYDLDLIQAILELYEKLNQDCEVTFLMEVLNDYKVKGIQNDDQLDGLHFVANKLICYDDEIEILEKVEGLDEAKVKFNLAYAYLKSNNCEKSLEIIEEILPNYFDNAQIIKLYTYCLQGARKYQKAIKFLEIYHELVGENDYFNTQMGLNNYFLKKYAIALKYLKLVPCDNLVAIVRGICYYNIKDYNNAIVDFETLFTNVGYQEEHLDLMQMLVQAYLEINEVDKAHQISEKIKLLQNK